MSDRIIQTVTPRQLRREFNGVGLTFLVVFALAVGRGLWLSAARSAAGAVLSNG